MFLLFIKGQVLETILQDVLDTPVSPELLPQEDDKIVQKDRRYCWSL